MHNLNRSAALATTFAAMMIPTSVLADVAPSGLLTPFEERRHETFVEQASSKPIDLLFIGDSAVEFWLAEGKAQWDQAFSSFNAANFGVQGADTKSVLWRLQNGELAYFQAKVIVMDALLAAGNPPEQGSEAAILAGNAQIVAEIRKHQPQAKILLLVVPRPSSHSLQAALREHFAEIADGSAVTFLDVTSEFVAADGGFDRTMGSGRGNALSDKGYAALAQALKPRVVELLDGA
jgi:lysophospholipase L1-like esterase